MVFDSENQMNRNKTQKHTSSNYNGLSWNKSRSKWIAHIEKDKNNVHIGYFLDEKEAARSHNEKATELFGDYAYLNDISDDEESDAVEDNGTQ